MSPSVTSFCVKRVPDLVGACTAASRARMSKRAIPSRSYVRPSIVLYDETSAAASSIGSISIADLSSSPDLLIVAGTSLRIPGFKKLVKEFSKAVKSQGGICIFVNREAASSKEWEGVFDFQSESPLVSFARSRGPG